MEDILDVYKMPYDLKLPVICKNEKPYQMVDNYLESLPVRPGGIQKNNSEIYLKGDLQYVSVCGAVVRMVVCQCTETLHGGGLGIKFAHAEE